MEDNEDFGPLESADRPSKDTSTEVTELKEEIAVLKAREAEQKVQQKHAEEEFGARRAKFMELFLQKEEELKKQKELFDHSENKVTELTKKLEDVKGELENIKAAVEVSETNKEDEMQKIKKQYQEETASLQMMIKEVANEASESTSVQYETEREKLIQLTVKYEEELETLRSKLSEEREGFLSSVAKSLKKVGAGVTGSDKSAEAENLEESMKKAKADAEILKSVVLPLEEEITALKEKLKQAEEKLHIQSQNGPLSSCLGEIVPARSSPSLPELDDSKSPEEKISELISYLKAEKAARIDLEMFVAVLNTQKTVLQSDYDKIQSECHELCDLLKQEKLSHDQLQQTWQMANDQFLESQRLMMMDMRRMESVLSSEQQRQIAELQQKDLEREAQERKVRELEELREKQKKQSEDQKKKDEKEKEKDAEKLTQRERSPFTGDDSDGEGATKDLAIRKVYSSSDLSEKDNFLDSGIHDNADTQSLSEVDGLTIRISPEKVISLPSLTEEQMKSITDPSPELEANKSRLASAKAKSATVSMEGRRLVSDKEWRLLQQELKASREKLGRPCDMCSNYETQLQLIQGELKTSLSKNKSVERHLENEKQSVAGLQNYIEELEKNLNDTAEDEKKQISSLTTKVEESEKYINGIKQQFTQSQLDLQDQLKMLTNDREDVQKELKRLQEENESLVGKHSKHSQQIQNEDINLPNNLEEMQLLLLKYREEIINAKVAKEHTEDTLKSEMLFLKDQVLGEQQEKNTMEETLTNDISTLQERLTLLESVKSELERESAVRAEAESKLRECEQALKNIQAKSKQLISALQQQVEEQSNARTKLENEVQNMKTKIGSLQVELDNSEAVQRDFVKLSQSLQIQLEKIRQAETEVRWQHEEDIDDCSNCKQQFSVTKRKHHCRHCGKIFCSDCIQKTVNSGPNFRASRVCDVCHTILVNDATPYFSMEPPSTPD